MSRRLTGDGISRLILAALVAQAGVAHADDPAPAATSTSTPAAQPSTAAAPDASAPTVQTSTSDTSAQTSTSADGSTPAVHASTSAPADMSDQSLGATIGAVAGGRTTPGGLQVAGHYLYQLSDQDWFDGVAAFTFGGGDAACFRDRMNTFLCDHSVAQGNELELAATVRRFIGGKGDFWPFLHAGVGIAVVRFGNDSVTGAAIPLHAGGGLRVSVAPAVAITAHAELELGFGLFNHTLGLEPQLGATIGAGAEFKL